MNDVGHLDDCKLVSGNELADLGPEAKGWLSAKYCIYPQVADPSGDLFRNDTPRKVLTLMHPFFHSQWSWPCQIGQLWKRFRFSYNFILRVCLLRKTFSQHVNHNHFHFLPFDFCTTFTF